MPLRHLAGLDHAVIAVRDLAAAAEAWRALGFTLSPRGEHSAHMGSANHTIMLGPDYFELLGITRPTEHNAPLRARLEQGEGLEMIAMRTDDAAAGAEELRARGVAAEGPLAFERPVPLPGGGEAPARFRIFRWPPGGRPGGIAVFACEHLTPETVWLPELQRHANGATRLLRVEVATPDPAAAAAELAALLDRPASGHAVETAPGRATVLFRAGQAEPATLVFATRGAAPAGGMATGVRVAFEAEG
ncbi:MAG: VOC family protein [Rubritepida sp.]|nr:VOC family protein [Rubritepida sp.]